MRPRLELLTRFLVDVRRAEHRIERALRRKRDRAGNHRAGGLHRLNDLLGGLVDQVVIVRFEFDAYFLTSHVGLRERSAVPS